MGDEEGGVWGHAFKSGGTPPPSPTPLVIIDIVEYLWCLILIRIIDTLYCLCQYRGIDIVGK